MSRSTMASDTAWQVEMCAALPDVEWVVDDRGDMEGAELWWDDHEATWRATLDGLRVGLEVGCVSIESDVVHDDYRLTVRSLAAGVKGWFNAE